MRGTTILYEIITRSTLIKNKHNVIRNNIKPLPVDVSGIKDVAPPIIFLTTLPLFCELNMKCSTKDPNMFLINYQRKNIFLQ